MDDIWCDFCKEKMKQVVLKKLGTDFKVHVCGHCESLITGYERVEDERKA